MPTRPSCSIPVSRPDCHEIDSNPQTVLIIHPRNVGANNMEMASELSQNSKKTIFGMIVPELNYQAHGVVGDNGRRS